MRFRSDGGHFIPSFLGVTGLNNLMAGEPMLSSSRALTPDVGPHVAYMYSNMAMEDRLKTLHGIFEQKKLGQVSPAPFSDPEVDLLCKMLDLQPGDGSRVDDGWGGFDWKSAAKKVGSFIKKEKLQLIPLDQV